MHPHRRFSSSLYVTMENLWGDRVFSWQNSFPSPKTGGIAKPNTDENSAPANPNVARTINSDTHVDVPLELRNSDHNLLLSHLLRLEVVHRKSRHAGKGQR